MNDYISPPYPCKPVDYAPDLAVYPCFLQPKYNGIRCMLGPDGRAWSKTGKEFNGLAGYFEDTGHWLDGEIVDWRSSTNDPASYTLQTIAGLVAAHDADKDELSKLVLVTFDIIEDTPQHVRLVKLVQMAPRWTRNIQFTPCVIVDTYAQANHSYHELPPNAEGMIYRDPNAVYQAGKTNAVLKRKKFKSAEYQCLAVHEGIGKYLGMFGGATLLLPDGQTFNCGGGRLTVKDRKKLWIDKPIGKLVTVEFPYYSDTGVPLQAQIQAIRNYE